VVAMCSAVKSDGSVCQAPPLQGSDRCFFHAQEAADARRAAQRSGGSNRRASLPSLRPVQYSIRNAAGVVSLLEATVNDARSGVTDPKLANTVGFLASILIKALAADQLEKRIEALEAAMKSRNRAERRVVARLKCHLSDSIELSHR
jgi:chaperonin cofactor prefoldin